MKYDNRTDRGVAGGSGSGFALRATPGQGREAGKLGGGWGQSEIPSSHPLTPSSPHSPEVGERGSAALRAVVWALAGALVMLFLVVDPFAVSPVDGWLGVVRSSQHVAHGGGLWTCGMHPEVIQEEPGICPICHMDLVPVQSDSGHGNGAGHDNDLWTCPMHPEILEAEPGSCPICGMDLVSVEDEPGHEDGIRLRPEGYAGTSGRGYGIVTIDPVVVQNMNVRVEPAQRRDLSRAIRTVGHLDYDQERMVSVTTRFEGFVEKVFVNYVGQPVRKGEPLFEVYSPELLQTQQELLSALRYERELGGANEEVRGQAKRLVEAARTRLSYWDISAEQISAIESNGEVFRTLAVVSPLDGVVMQRMHGLEGMAIRPGMEALHVADLSSLWLTVEVYEDQLPWLGEGSSALVVFDYLPGETFSGRVRYVEPEVSPQTRTVKLTLEVPNRDRRLRVGMYATVQFNPVVAREAVVVPAQAVIRTGERDIVVVALGEGRFAPLEVTLGAQSEGFIQVLDGLDGDEQVVTSAQFLIDSESNLRAAIDRLMAAHDHGGDS